jgi:hypothetical protein
MSDRYRTAGAALAASARSYVAEVEAWMRTGYPITMREAKVALVHAIAEIEAIETEDCHE